MKKAFSLIVVLLTASFLLASCGGGGGGGGGSSAGTSTDIVGTWKLTPETMAAQNTPAGFDVGVWYKSDGTFYIIMSTDGGKTWTYSNTDKKTIIASGNKSWGYRCGTYSVSGSTVTWAHKNGSGTHTSTYSISGDTISIVDGNTGVTESATRFNVTPVCID